MSCVHVCLCVCSPGDENLTEVGLETLPEATLYGLPITRPLLVDRPGDGRLEVDDVSSPIPSSLMVIEIPE